MSRAVLAALLALAIASMRPIRIGRRLRLRTLLIAVAVAGLALGGWQMWERREYCVEHAAFWELARQTETNRAQRWQQHYEETRRFVEAEFRDGRLPEEYQDYREDSGRAARAWAAANHAARRAAQYRHVARYPWLPLPREPE